MASTTPGQSILDRATARDVFRFYGLDVPDIKRLVRCPLHADSTASLRVFERGYRCFGCGAHGGVLDLVIALNFAADRAAAAVWLEDRLG